MQQKHKVKGATFLEVHLPSKAIDGYIIKSVVHGQSDTDPWLLSAAQRDHPFVSTKSYCFEAESLCGQ